MTGEEDSDMWAGTAVKLITVKVEFQGKRVPAIRIEEPPRKNGSARPAAPPVPPQHQNHEPVDAPGDDDIPF
jgi:hypothetical protein